MDEWNAFCVSYTCTEAFKTAFFYNEPPATFKTNKELESLIGSMTTELRPNLKPLGSYEATPLKAIRKMLLFCEPRNLAKYNSKRPFH